jgi:hypothetical protein
MYKIKKAKAKPIVKTLAERILRLGLVGPLFSNVPEKNADHPPKFTHHSSSSYLASGFISAPISHSSQPTNQPIINQCMI